DASVDELVQQQQQQQQRQQLQLLPSVATE
ncbi:hypothetical protein AWZ03_015151, partial [Drosophila navojoa]